MNKNNLVLCPICRNREGTTCEQLTPTNADRHKFACQYCGTFELTGSVYAAKLDPQREALTIIESALIGHTIREENIERGKIPVISTNSLETFLKSPRLPSPAIQAANAIRYIGDYVLREGKTLDQLQPSIATIIGAPGAEFAGDLVHQLKEQGIIGGIERQLGGIPTDILEANLTLRGWEIYEGEKKGRTVSATGFLAMKFGDSALDNLAATTLKPAVKRIGYDLVDMRDVTEAGIIDNILRARIRDAAFVIADLTHDNPGAYWEAGYAEGLGKPVIYICERKKFETEKTHFDTNHSTTVCWLPDDTAKFEAELVATLRRSLNLF
jgi:nucleoside 2-deoxyribosyltransferase